MYNVYYNLKNCWEGPTRANSGRDNSVCKTRTETAKSRNRDGPPAGRFGEGLGTSGRYL